MSRSAGSLRRKSLSLLLVSLSVLCFSPGRAAEAMVPSYQVEDLTRLSTDIIVGRVVDATAEWQDWPYGGRVIMTTYTVQVAERLKGTPRETIAVVVPGGTVGGTTIAASDCPELSIGNDVALFLKKDLKGLSRYWVFGLERGAFEIVEGDARPLAHDALPLPLTSLKTRVTRALEAENGQR